MTGRPTLITPDRLDLSAWSWAPDRAMLTVDEVASAFKLTRYAIINTRRLPVPIIVDSKGQWKRSDRSRKGAGRLYWKLGDLRAWKAARQ